MNKIFCKMKKDLTKTILGIAGLIMIATGIALIVIFFNLDLKDGVKMMHLKHLVPGICVLIGGGVSLISGMSRNGVKCFQNRMRNEMKDLHTNLREIRVDVKAVKNDVKQNHQRLKKIEKRTNNND